MKKNKKENIEIMEGIDFKSNQARIRKEIKRVKKQQKIEQILFVFIALAIMVGTMTILSHMDKAAIKKCVNAGNSRYYCEKHI